MKAPFIFFILSLSTTLSAQVILSGQVLEMGGDPLAGVNVYIKGTYEGTSTNEEGMYEFITRESGVFTLVASFIGYKTQEILINPNNQTVINDFRLRESSNRLDAVVISAGMFEASDEKKSVIFNSLDIVTTAGGLANIPSVINTLPGTQTVGEEGKLFVRGGDSYETRTFIDGMIVDQPYESTLPDIHSRSRFSPFLFSGTLFSSGGYSAEYGQALSSVLVLHTNDLPAETVTGISLMTLGLGASHTQRWNNTSLSLSADYFNLSPYFAVIPQNFDWIDAPNGLLGNLVLRQKTGKNGMVKLLMQYSRDNSGLNYPDYRNITSKIPTHLFSENLYVNATFRDLHGKKFISNGGFSLTNNQDDVTVLSNVISEQINNNQFRYNLTWLVSDAMNLKAGVELWNRNFRKLIDYTDYAQRWDNGFFDDIYSGFIESEIRLTSKFASRIGGRYEYSTYLQRSNLAPRLSLAYKTGAASQVSFAYGHFFQSPENDYLLFNCALDYEKSTHYILNYQFSKNDHIFRVETYLKDYDNLVKYKSLYNMDPATYNNKGSGRAQGVDIFYRDKSMDNLDYWISYSFIDTRRDYRDFPVSATPAYISNHNLTIVSKYFIPKITTQVGLTYKFTSGRPYYNPSNPQFLADMTKSFNDLSLNLSYLTSFWDNFTIIHLSIGNILGFENIFGYHFGTEPGSGGEYPSYAIKPGAKRFFFLGVFTSIN